jgi:serine/threonine protein kinase
VPPFLLWLRAGAAPRSLFLPPEHTMNPTTSADPAEGYSLDPLAGTSFRTLRKLGEGSMGLVVEAENRALGTVVVIKLLHAALSIRADYVDRLRLEAQALARLRHPNLVIVTDFSVTPAGVPFFVMERLFGRTVEDERRVRGALPLREAIAIVRQALAGLAAVHAAGIVHRDIKSANLFLCDADAAGLRVVKVLDFGIAKVLSSAPAGRAPQPLRFPTAEGTTVGTPRCLSPEQACGGPVDGRTDIYAAGVLCMPCSWDEGRLITCAVPSRCSMPTFISFRSHRPGSRRSRSPRPSRRPFSAHSRSGPPIALQARWSSRTRLGAPRARERRRPNRVRSSASIPSRWRRPPTTTRPRFGSRPFPVCRRSPRPRVPYRGARWRI